MANRRKFKSPEEMEEKIEAYFEDCEGKILTNPTTGEVVLDKFGQPIIYGQKPLTVTGLALALGFTSRRALLNYQDRKDFTAIIEKAKLRVENYAEMRLYDKDGANGARFNLQNNFRDWDAGKAKEENHGAAVNIICDLPKPDTAPELPNTAHMSIDPQMIAQLQKEALNNVSAGGGTVEQQD